MTSCKPIAHVTKTVTYDGEYETVSGNWGLEGRYIYQGHVNRFNLNGTKIERRFSDRWVSGSVNIIPLNFLNNTKVGVYLATYDKEGQQIYSTIVESNHIPQSGRYGIQGWSVPLQLVRMSGEVFSLDIGILAAKNDPTLPANNADIAVNLSLYATS